MDQHNLPKQLLNRSMDADSFGCCEHYRECSDVKRCILQDNSYAVRCSYKRAMENGLVYYGKNASDFSMVEYSQILTKVDELSNADKETFYRVIMMFCFYKRCAPYIIARKEWMNAISNVGVFRASPLGLYLPQHSGVKALVSAIRKHPDAYVAYSDAEKMQKATKGESNSPPFVKQWLCGAGSATLEILSEPYCILSPVDGLQQYLEEIFNDRLVNCLSSYPPLGSPLAEDGWMTQSDSKKLTKKDEIE